MFHLHVEGASNAPWLSEYDGSNYSNNIMGKWFRQYKRDIQIYILFINHPVHPI